MRSILRGVAEFVGVMLLIWAVLRPLFYLMPIPERP